MPSSRHLVDQELLAALDLMPAVGLSLEALPQIRQMMDEFAAARPATAGISVATERRFIPASDGHRVPVLIHRPHNLPASAPAIIYVHGGGYLLGSAEMVRPANQRLAQEAACLVVSVDYRLPPETPHPGPVEDCYTALRWLHENAIDLGVDPRRIAVAGESAGGGLAAALALLARDRGAIRLVHQHLIYPMLDDRTCRETANPFAGEFIWTAEQNQMGWFALLGPPAQGQEISPYAAAARAKDLAGLPSTFIMVGALDLFAEEDMEYARRLMRAGVPTELHLYPGAYHGFELAADAAVTNAAHHVSLNALRRALSEL